MTFFKLIYAEFENMVLFSLCIRGTREWDAGDVYKLFIGQLNISYRVLVWFTNKSKQSADCCTFIFFLLSLNLDTHSQHVYLYFRPIEPGGVSSLPPVPLGTSKHINFVHSWWWADDKLRLLARVYVCMYVCMCVLDSGWLFFVCIRVPRVCLLSSSVANHAQLNRYNSPKGGWRLKSEPEEQKRKRKKTSMS